MKRFTFKQVVFMLGLGPVLALPIIFMMSGFGANPVEFLVRYFGDWALRFLLLALAVTPIRRLTGWTRLATVRRMVGLYAFFYVSLHVSAYVGLDLFFDFQAFVHDVWKRKFITVGMVAFVLLVPLAVTSTNRMVQRLGGIRWRMLHRLVYVIGPLAVLHYFWMVKADILEPLIYGGILGVLLLLRLPKMRHLTLRA